MSAYCEYKTRISDMYGQDYGICSLGTPCIHKSLHFSIRCITYSSGSCGVNVEICRCNRPDTGYSKADKCTHPNG